MSGQPNRYTNSAEMFRNQYMDALNSRANVDEYNLQANKNYKATGSLPPQVTQMVDNRTTTEILADTEKLKLNIISELKPVMNSGTASVVVQKIQTAPANADGSFLIWVAQNIPEIIRSLKKKYALGIKGDTQDATNIVLFLSDMYSKIKDYTGTVKSYFDNAGDSRSGLKEGDLDALRKEYEIIVTRLKTKFPNYRQPSERAINDLIIKTTERIQRLYNYLTSSGYKHIISELQNVRGRVELSQVNGMNEIGKAVFKLLDQLPSVSLVRALYKQLDRSLENKDAIGAPKTHTSLSVKILQEIHDLFPSVDEIDRVYDLFVDQGPDNPPDDFNNEFPPDEDEDWVGDFKNVNDFMNNELTRVENIPEQLNMYNELLRVKNETIDKLFVIRDQIDDASRMTEKRIKILASRQTEIYQSGKYSNQQKNLFRDKLNKALEDYRKQENMLNNVEFTIEGIRSDIKQIENDMKRLKIPIQRPPDIQPLKPVKGVQSQNQSRIPKQSMQFPDSGRKIELTKQLELNNAKSDKIEYQLVELEKYINKKNEELFTTADQSEVERLEKIIESSKKDFQDLEEQLRRLKDERDDIQSQISGSGLKKRRGRPKGSGIAFKDNIDHTKGIQPVKKYHPFGKYFVNSHKLNNGSVLSIKSKSGTNVREYPSRIVSPQLGQVIKTIIGGGVPSWNDMNKLTEEEKDYLYKVSKRAEFSDKISVPTPSKDQQEKDIHEFEVCKGEIMAGNDSKELIKKFKLLIIKLSKNGTIPKRESSEVMQELLELGY
jgi:hypothetical protein